MSIRPVLADVDVGRLLEVSKPVPQHWRSGLLPVRTSEMDLRAILDLGDLPAACPLRGRLHLYSRQNLNPEVLGDWSVGMVYTDYAERSYRILRCNGPHPNAHVNRIERDVIDRHAHIHLSTERYQTKKGANADGYAEPTDAYSTIEGALDHLAGLIHLTVEGRLFI